MAATVRAGHEEAKAEPSAPPATTRRGGNKVWKQLNGFANDVGCGADNTFIISNKNQHQYKDEVYGSWSVQRREGKKFVDFDNGLARRIDVDD